MLELQEGFQEFGNAFIPGQPSDKEGDRCIEGDLKLISQLDRALYSLWRRRETRDVHAIATSGPENHRPLRSHETAGDGLLSYAVTDTHHAVRKTACEALEKD